MADTKTTKTASNSAYGEGREECPRCGHEFSEDLMTFVFENLSGSATARHCLQCAIKREQRRVDYMKKRLTRALSEI